MITDDSTIYAKRNKYGYQLNINHPLIRPHYERFKVKCNTPILSDAQHFAFERLMIEWIERLMIEWIDRKKTDRTQKRGLPDGNRTSPHR